MCAESHGICAFVDSVGEGKTKSKRSEKGLKGEVGKPGEIGGRGILRRSLAKKPRQ